MIRNSTKEFQQGKRDEVVEEDINALHGNNRYDINLQSLSHRSSQRSKRSESKDYDLQFMDNNYWGSTNSIKIDELEF